MNFVRQNEREKDRTEHIFCFKYLGKWILRHNEREREKGTNIESVLKIST